MTKTSSDPRDPRDRERAMEALESVEVEIDHALRQENAELRRRVANAEAALAAGDHASVAFHKSSVGLCLIDASGTVLAANTHFAEVVGRPMGAIVKQPVSALGFDEAVKPSLFERALREGAIANCLTRCTREDGEVRAALVSAHRVPMLVHGALQDCLVVSVVDFTDRQRADEASRRAEAQLRQAQKLESSVRLAGGVAHDFNNLLSVVLSYTTLLAEDLEPEDPMLADLEEIRRAGERAVELTRQLLAFSRQQMLQPRVLDLNQVVTEMRKMLTRVLGEGIKLAIFTQPSLGRVHADRSQIEDVVLHLAMNAKDAMPQGGAVSLETSNTDLTDPGAAAAAGVTPGHYATVSLTDTGVGMDENVRTRLFEPFFTTKEKGKGMGLGLATVFGIVQQSGGNILVESQPQRGSTFRILLPRTAQLLEAVPAPAAQAPLLQGTEIVLLVDDEDQVRAITRVVLQRAGYRVLEASNGEDALLVCEQHPSRIHLLVTDVMMPVMNGPKLAARVTKLRSDIKVVYMSGYTGNALVENGELAPEIAFLQKPVAPETLLRKVREVLDGAPGMATAREANG